MGWHRSERAALTASLRSSVPCTKTYRVHPGSTCCNIRKCITGALPSLGAAPALRALGLPVAPRNLSFPSPPPWGQHASRMVSVSRYGARHMAIAWTTSDPLRSLPRHRHQLRVGPLSPATPRRASGWADTLCKVGSAHKMEPRSLGLFVTSSN